MTEHYRPNGKLASGYWCPNCGQPCNMYGSGHHDKDWNKICPPNPTLVRQLRMANPSLECKPVFTVPGVISEITVDC